jgi:hypothetical protein
MIHCLHRPYHLSLFSTPLFQRRYGDRSKQSYYGPEQKATLLLQAAMAYLLLYVNNCEIMTQISARKSEDLESLVHQNRSSADVAFVLAPVFGLSLAAERLTKPRDFMLQCCDP